MYSYPKVIDSKNANPITAACSMYRMPKLYLEPTNSFSSSAAGSVKNNMPMDIQGVLRRQTELLDKVKSLKAEVESSLKSGSSGTKSSATDSTCGQKSSPQSSLVQDFFKGSCAPDIVLAADPSNPPLAALVLCQQVCACYKTLFKVHTHSSVNELSSKLRELFPASTVASRADYQLIITLVWKKVPRGCELMVSPHSQVHVQGSAVVARFLASLLGWKPTLLEATVADQWLERAEACTDQKQAAALYKSLGDQFKNRPFLVTGTPCVADTVVWAVLAQAGLLHTPRGVVGAWQGRLTNLPEYQRCQTLAS